MLFKVIFMVDVLIIGAGPAGLAAALQLKRYGVDIALIERTRAGGLLNNANLVENYPGFPGGITGEELIKLFTDQVTQSGVKISYDEIQSLDYSDNCFKAVGRGRSYLAPMAIVASGTKGKLPERIVIPATIKDKVMTEILPIKNTGSKRIVIIGAGDLAFDYALNLGRKNAVAILNRFEEMKCLPLLQDRIRNLSSVKYQNQTRLVDIQAGENGEIILDTNTPGGRQQFSCDYLIFAIGREPCTDFFSEDLRKYRTDLEQNGIFHLIGDVGNGIFRQAAIAVGDGIECAMRVYIALEEKQK
jgi:thioredoxin reductase